MLLFFFNLNAELADLGLRRAASLATESALRAPASLTGSAVLRRAASLATESGLRPAASLTREIVSDE